MRVFYGPIDSWRFGRSLGVDPLAGRTKRCPLSCIYCQYGPTERPTRRRATFVTVEQIRAAFDKRRTRPTNPLQRLLRALLGVDAKVAQYVRGKAFVDHVVGRVGMARFNAIWTDADTLPKPDEIEDGDRWIARVLG